VTTRLTKREDLALIAAVDDALYHLDHAMAELSTWMDEQHSDPEGLDAAALRGMRLRWEVLTGARAKLVARQGRGASDE
jgi:hypothetical protein